MTADQSQYSTTKETPTISTDDSFERDDDALQTDLVDIGPGLLDEMKSRNAGKDDDKRVVVDITSPITMPKDIERLNEFDEEDGEMEKPTQFLSQSLIGNIQSGQQSKLEDQIQHLESTPPSQVIKHTNFEKERHVDYSHEANPNEEINIPEHPALSPLEKKTSRQTHTKPKPTTDSKPSGAMKAKDLTLKTNTGKAIGSICLCQPIPKIPRPRNGECNSKVKLDIIY